MDENLGVPGDGVLICMWTRAGSTGSLSVQLSVSCVIVRAGH